MRKNLLIRVITLTLAWVHTFPALKHVRLFMTEPTLAEAWKGFGGAFAACIYLLPPSWHAKGLVALWNRRRMLLVFAGWLLAIAHGVPAIDHLPKFMEDGSWGDAWRGFGSALAALWFVLPVHLQARALRSIQEAGVRFAELCLARRPRPSGVVSI
jgi:hypothetical protein